MPRKHRPASQTGKSRANGSGLDNPTIVGATEGTQTYPAISRQGPSGDHYVVYADDRSSTADVFGQRYLPPQARFSASPVSGYAPLSVTYTDRSTTPYGDAWLWNFGDGATSPDQNPEHTYTTPGQYTTVFTVTWWDHTYTTSLLIAVTNPVQPQFTASPLNGTRPLTVTFTDQSTTVDGTLTAWQWDFGDGVTSTLRNPTHVYPNNGKYDVTLTVGTGTYTNTLTQAGLIVVGAPHRTVINYTHDGLYRLTDANYSTGQRFQYTYDAVGNRTA